MQTTHTQVEKAEIEKRVIALIRVSTEEQASKDKTGIPRQHAAIEAGVRLHGLTVEREEVVVDVSGRHVMDDPQFQGIFRDLKSGKVGGVIVAELSRLARPENPGDFIVYDPFKLYKRIIYTPS